MHPQNISKRHPRGSICQEFRYISLAVTSIDSARSLALTIDRVLPFFRREWEKDGSWRDTDVGRCDVVLVTIVIGY